MGKSPLRQVFFFALCSCKVLFSHFFVVATRRFKVTPLATAEVISASPATTLLIKFLL